MRFGLAHRIMTDSLAALGILCLVASGKLHLYAAVLVVVGVAFIRKGRSSSPVRLVLGWGLVAVAALGLLHVIRSPDSFTDLDGLGEGGGWFGALVVEPIATLIATPGAVVVLLAVGVGGALLITQTSLRTMAMHTGRGVGAVAKPLVTAPEALEEALQIFD